MPELFMDEFDVEDLKLSVIDHYAYLELTGTSSKSVKKNNY